MPYCGQDEEPPLALLSGSYDDIEEACCVSRLESSSSLEPSRVARMSKAKLLAAVGTLATVLILGCSLKSASAAPSPRLSAPTPQQSSPLPDVTEKQPVAPAAMQTASMSKTPISPELLAKLFTSDEAGDDLFGRSVSKSGNTVVIGVAQDDEAGSESGSAFVFVKTGKTWALQAKLTANDAAAFQNFGRSVSISGDTIVVGALHEEDEEDSISSGSAYVFVRSDTTWTQQAKLTSAVEGDEFGYSVSICRDTIVVGAHFDDSVGTKSGTVYVYARTGSEWNLQAKLIADDATSFDWFGESVSISQDTIAIGAYGEDDEGSDKGSAYVFVRSGDVWNQQTKLIANDDKSDGELFRVSVSIKDHTLVLGSFYDDGASTSGSACVFVRKDDAWHQEEKVAAKDKDCGDCVGKSVAVSGDTFVLGEYDYGAEPGSAGSSYYLY